MWLAYVALGLVSFVLGLRAANRGLTGMAGPGLARALRFARNRVLGVLLGAVVTAAVQSSTATTLALIALVDARALSAGSAFAVVMGANVGTCLTVQLAAFRLEAWSVAALLGGLATVAFGPRRLRPAALVLTGAGSLALGMGLMRSAARSAPQAWTAWVAVVSSVSPLRGALAAAGLTAVLQSSAAVAGAAVAIAESSGVGVRAALPVVLGANVGTCVTGLLASVGRSRASRLTAVLNLLFNLAGAAAALCVFPWFARLVCLLPGGPGRQVAHAHTLLNVASVVVCLPFAGRVVEAAERLAGVDARSGASGSEAWAVDAPGIRARRPGRERRRHGTGWRRRRWRYGKRASSDWSRGSRNSFR